MYLYLYTVRISSVFLFIHCESKQCIYIINCESKQCIYIYIV